MLAREENREKSLLPTCHTRSCNVQRPTAPAMPAMMFYNPQGTEPPRPSGFVQFILCVVLSVSLREPSIDPARHIRSYPFILGKNDPKKGQRHEAPGCHGACPPSPQRGSLARNDARWLASPLSRVGVACTVNFSAKCPGIFSDMCLLSWFQSPSSRVLFRRPLW